MGTGWRRAFCTSIRRDPETASPIERQPSSSPSPRSCTRLGFLGKSGGSSSSSNPSTPRLLQHNQSQPSTPTLRCRTKSPAGPGPADVAVSPKLQCKTSIAASRADAAAPGSYGRSPRLPFVSSNPSSPKSPSRFALLRNNLRLTRSNCGICLQSVKTKQGTAIFTAECSHVFHFHCIAANVRKQGSLVCPVCRAAWRQVPFLSDLSIHQCNPAPSVEEVEQDQKTRHPGLKQGIISPAGDDYQSNNKKGVRDVSGLSAKVYNDDEPLLSPTACVTRRFNPIPEAEEEQQEEDKEGGDDEFQGFFSVDPSPLSSPRCKAGRRHQLRSELATTSGVQVAVLPNVALLSIGRVHENYVVALKVKAPSPTMPRAASTAAAGADGSATAPVPLLEPSRRAPIDLVTVLDVGGNMTDAKLHMMKRAMRLLVASLGPADRLSIVAFSTSAKRLLALRRMSPDGQSAARQIVDRLACVEGSCAGEALRKAVKVLEDRRERNPVASIMLLSDGQQQQGEHHNAASPSNGNGVRRPISPSDISSPNTRFTHLEIPVPASGFGRGHRLEDAEDVFARCVGGLLSVVLQDVRLEFTFPSGEVCSVYSCGGRAVALGGGAGPFRLGDMYADEERELLVELRVPCSRRGGAEQDHQLLSLSVRCTYRDPSTQELVHGREQPLLVPLGRHDDVPAAATKVEQLQNLFVTTRSIAEARRLADHGDYAMGFHLLSSARRLLLQSSSFSADENLRAVEAELEELQCRRERTRMLELPPDTPTLSALDDAGGAEALTPTSAWRAAERLAKVAIMRKSLNRVIDLHGFENARF